MSAAQAIGLDPKLLIDRLPGPPDDATVAFIRPLVERASLALTVNEAWAMLACAAIIGLMLVPFARDRTPASPQGPRDIASSLPPFRWNRNGRWIRFDAFFFTRTGIHFARKRSD